MTTFPKSAKLATMPRLQPSRNCQFGSKIKIPKNIRKTTLELHQSCCEQETAFKTPKIRKMTTLSKSAKLASMPRLQPLQNAQFGSKIKFPKSCEKRLQKYSRVLLSKKRLLKTPNIRKMTTFPKSAKLATMPRLQPLQNAQFGSKIKFPKSCGKRLQNYSRVFLSKKRLLKHLIFEK